MRSYKALGSVVHDAELKPLLVLEGFGKGAAQGVRRQNFLTAVLELSEDALNDKRTQTHSEVSDRRPVRDRPRVAVGLKFSPSEHRRCTSPPYTCEWSADGNCDGRCRDATGPDGDRGRKRARVDDEGIRDNHHNYHKNTGQLLTRVQSACSWMVPITI